MKSSRVIPAVLLLLWIVGSPSSMALASKLIDDFSVGSILVERTADTIATAEQTGLDLTRVVGGERSFAVGEFGIATQTLSVDATMGSMTFETGATPGYFTVGYGSVESPLGLDLMANGADAFVVDFFDDLVYPQSNRFGVGVHTATGSGFVSPNSFGVEIQTLANGLSRVVLPFELYVTNVDFRQVDRIELGVARFPQNSSITFHLLATIPEPSTLMLCAGCIGAISWRVRG